MKAIIKVVYQMSAYIKADTFEECKIYGRMLH